MEVVFFFFQKAEMYLNEIIFVYMLRLIELIEH